MPPSRISQSTRVNVIVGALVPAPTRRRRRRPRPPPPPARPPAGGGGGGGGGFDVNQAVSTYRGLINDFNMSRVTLTAPVQTPSVAPIVVSADRAVMAARAADAAVARGAAPVPSSPALAPVSVPPQLDRVISKGYSTPSSSPSPTRREYADESPLLSLPRLYPGAFSSYGPNYADDEAPLRTAFASAFSPPVSEAPAEAVSFTTKGGVLRCDGCAAVRGNLITAAHRHSRQHVTVWHALRMSDLRTDQQRNALNRENAFMLSSPPR
jgi:hypothetical protein